MKTRYLISTVLLLHTSLAFSEEVGIGRGGDIPDAPPADPAPAETAESLWQQVLEWFEGTGQ